MRCRGSIRTRCNILLLDFLFSHSKKPDANIGIIVNVVYLWKTPIEGHSLMIRRQMPTETSNVLCIIYLLSIFLQSSFHKGEAPSGQVDNFPPKLHLSCMEFGTLAL